MRAAVLGLALLVMPAAAQDRAPAKKKPAAKQLAHKKATPEQIRKFNELQKKQQTQPR